MHKGQAALETLIILAVALLVFLAIFSVTNKIMTGTSGKIESTKARTAVDSLADSAELVYQQGVGSRTRVFVTLPDEIQSFNASEQSLDMQLYSGGNLKNVYRSFDFNVSGTLPDDEGNYWIYVKSLQNSIIFYDSANESAAAYCGDLVVDTGEDCDGSNLGGETCLSQGYLLGTLSCYSNCTFDTRGCVAALPSISLALFSPTTNTNFTRNLFNEFTVNVTCSNADCGEINISLGRSEWWNSSWGRRKEINITNAGSTNLTNFPAYLNVSKQSGMQADYDDLRFISGACDNAGGSELDYEIENYTISRADIWVRIPTLSMGVTSVCMYYNNSDASSGENPAAVWDSNYLGVWHLAEGGTGTRYDSTIYGNDGTPTNYDGDEKTTLAVDGADDLDGASTGDYIQTTSDVSAEDDITLEIWFNSDDTGLKHMMWTGNSGGNGWGAQGEMHISTGYNNQTSYNNFLSFYSGTEYPPNAGIIDIKTPFTDTAGFHYAAFSVSDISSSPSANAYLDGSLFGSDTGTTSGVDRSDWNTNIRLGQTGTGTGRYFNGILDEARVSNTTRSAEWINQTYQMIANPESFVTFGSEESQTAAKGLISTAAGATPFYTNKSSNPFNISLNQGESQLVTFWVNATGSINSTYEFYVHANMTSNMSINNITDKINVTITELVEVAPSIAIALYTPTTNANFTRESFNEFTVNVTCSNADCGEINISLDPSNWWNTSWDNRKEINITNAGSTNLINFPSYLNISKQSGMQADYDDLRFINGSCTSSDSTELDYEIENYTSANAHIWIRIPTLSAGNSSICMYYNNSDAGSGEDATGVWINDYVAVHHLQESSGNHQDSSSRNNDATATSVSIQGGNIGRIDGADDFDNLNTDYVSFTTTGMLTSSGTVSLWGNMDSSTGTRSYLFSHRTGLDPNRIYIYEQSGTLYVGFADVFANNIGYTITPDEWHLYTLVWSGANWEMYMDGGSEGSGSSAILSSIDSSSYLGSFLSVKEYFDGIIDEFEISNVSRSAEWINQTYQMVVNHDSFVAFGSEESQTAAKGLISTAAGATPFYTNKSSNPFNISLNQGESQLVTFWVNATGSAGSTYEFYAYANMTSNMSINNITNKINITIISEVNQAPTHTTPILNATSANNLTTDNLTCHNQSTDDANGDDVKNIFNWYKDGSSIISLNMPFEGGSNSTWTRDYALGNNGTVSGATWSSTGGYDGKGAYSFDGNDYIESADSASLDLTSQLTITAWINPGQIDPWDRIVAKSHTMDFFPWTIYGLLFDDANHIRMEIATSGSQNVVNGNTAIPINTWTFVAGTYDGTQMKLYMNGSLDNSNPHSGSIDTNNMPLSIGRSGFGSHYFNGMIDEVMIFNYSLSADQILALYQNRTDVIVSDETSGGDIWQCSINPNDGTQDGTTLQSNNLEIIP